MSVAGIKLLNYLHDATIREVAWVSSPSGRDVRIRAACHEECGYPHWAGRNVTVTFNNVLLSSTLLLGHVVGEETFNSCGEDISVEMKELLGRLIRSGIDAPKVVLRVTFHSGSEVYIACDEVVVVAEESPGLL